jgi:hypothetical protein
MFKPESLFFAVSPQTMCVCARRRAARSFHDRNKDNEEYKMKQRANSKRVYEKDKERVIARVRANQI